MAKQKASDIDSTKFARKATHQGLIHHELVTVDEAISAAAYGPEGDTISSRVLRWKLGMVPHPNFIKKAVGSALCAMLGIIQPRHDLKANIADYARAKAEMERTKRVILASGAKLPDDE